MSENAKPSLDQSEWTLLLHAIQRKKCIVLLGPGVAVDPDDPSGVPLNARLAQSLASALESAGKGDALLARSDLAHVAQIYERQMRGKRPGLELAAEAFYKPYEGRTTSLHRDLAALPFTLCVSTTPDRFLLNAFTEAPGKEPTYDYHHFQPDPTRVRERSARVMPPEENPETKPLIFDLYGSLDELDSLVLTENDLLDYLVSVARQSPPLHPYVSSQFSDPTVSFLFLGFGFHQWYVRILLHVLKAAGHVAPSLALEDATFFDHPSHQEAALFFQSGHLLEFRKFPWPDFVAELRRSYEATVVATRKTTAAAVALPDDAPLAFLCHENRDKPEAERIARELQEAGVRIWLDKQSLRGGDDWVKAIPRIIGQTCDYVIVLQSPRMLDERESYFHREIRMALQRQEGMAPGFAFIIPVIIEADKRLPLEQLQGIHFIDLADAGTAALAETIMLDWKRSAGFKIAR